MFMVKDSTVSFSGLGFMSGSATYYGGCLYMRESTVDLKDIDFTSCVTKESHGGGVSAR